MSNASAEAGVVTREQAEAVRQAVIEKYPAYCTTFPTIDGQVDFDAEPVAAPDAELPRLVQNYAWSERHDPVPWAVVWEEGPYDWALLCLDDSDVDVEMTAELREFVNDQVIRTKAVKQPKGVYCEPISGHVLGIYPA